MTTNIKDFQKTHAVNSWYYALIIIMLLTFTIANILRAVHNHMHLSDKLATEFYYQNAPEYDFLTTEEAIERLAEENKKLDVGKEVIVPRRLITF